MSRLEHGTPEGYDRGCTDELTCPATHIHGMSCQTAHYRFMSGERRYMNLRGRGYTSTRIARELGFTPTTAIRKELDNTRAAQVASALDRAETTAAQITTAHPDPTPAPAPIEEPPMSTSATTTLGTEERALIRTWAADNHITVGKGKIPQAVIDACLNDNPALAGKYHQPPKAKPRPPAAPTATGSGWPTPHEIRAWALENGLDVNPRGNVRTDVVTAYREAHTDAAQPLAESSQDRMPEHDTADAPSDSPTTVEPDEAGRREEMGHPTTDEDAVEWELAAENLDDDEQLAESPDITDLQTRLNDATDVGDLYRAVKDAGEFAARWNDLPVDQRMRWIELVGEERQAATNCAINMHAAVLERNQNEITAALHRRIADIIATGVDENDDRILAMERIVKHHFFATCFDTDGPLIDAMIAKLDTLEAADIAHRSDLLDQTRERIGEDKPRPDWATVTISEDVERARGIAVRLEQELAETEQQRDQAYASLEVVLRVWNGTVGALRLTTEMLHQAENDLSTARGERDLAQQLMWNLNKAWSAENERIYTRLLDDPPNTARRSWWRRRKAASK